MSRIVIDDLKNTDSHLIDLSDSNLKEIRGGQEITVIIVEDHGDHYCVTIITITSR